MPDSGSPSLAGRAVLALALTVVFYTFAISVGVALAGLPVYQVATGGWFNVWIALTMFVTGVTILYGIVPRRRKFEAPGPELTAAEHPALFAMIEEVARKSEQEMPSAVYLASDVNAAVTERGGFLGMGGRKVLIVGLPLMAILSEDELKGVIAHEFGHYVGRDTKFGAWTWRTREAIFRTLELLHDEDEESLWHAAVSKPFEWYAKLFLRLTTAISRRQEFAADAVAAAIAGRDAHVCGLRRIHRVAPAFDAYWMEDVVATIEHGGRAPIVAGWHGFLAVEPVNRAIDEGYARIVAEDRESDPYSSHPTVVERLAAFGAEPDWPADSPTIPAEPSTRLLGDLDATEQRLVDWMTVDGVQLEDVDWRDVGQRLHVPRHRAIVEEHADALKGLTVESGVEWLVRGQPKDRPFTSAEASFDEARAVAASAIASGLIVALTDQGWQLDALPGLPIRCVRADGERALEPFSAISAALDGKLTPEEWRESCAAEGIGELPLYPSSAPRASETEKVPS